MTADPSSSPPPAGARASRWRLPPLDHPLLLAGLILLELLLSFGDVVFGPWGQMHWEELFNTRAGLQAACGHLTELDVLQYRTFCGGCTAEAAMAAPLFLAIGPTVLVWKALLLVFHAGVLAGGALLLRKIGGPAGPGAALAWVGLLAAAPGWYRELLHTGWGNHVECAAFPLLALALLLRPGWDPAGAAAPAGGGLSAFGGGLLRGFVGGLLLGAGLWFGQTSAWGAPLVLLATLDARRVAARVGAALGLLPAAAVGMLPWFAYYGERPNDADATLDWWTRLSIAPAGAMVDWLFGPYLREHLWDPPDYGPQGWGGPYWALLWALGLIGAGRLLAQRRWGTDRPGLIGALVVPGCLGVLLSVYVLRYDLWSNLPDLYVNGAFNLRYRTPLIPILGLGAALCAAWPWAAAPARALSRLALLGLLLIGLGLRFGRWQGPNTALVGLRAYLHDGWADKVVPLGQPPQPLLRAQGRGVDIDAAVRFLEDHDDPLPDCRLDHAHELGRRLGLGLAAEGLGPHRRRVAAAVAALPDPVEQELLAEGLGRALLSDQGEAAPDLPGLLAGLDAVGAEAGAPGLGARAGGAAGKRAHGAFRPEGDAQHAASLPPAVWDGVCAGRGRWQIWTASNDGRHPPRPLLDPSTVAAEAGACAPTAAYAAGAGAAWARYAGCGPGAAEALQAWLGPEADPAGAAEGLAAGCARLR